MDRSDQNPGADSRNGPQPPRELAIPLAAAGFTNAEVAKRLGVHRSTVGRWREDESWLAEVESERNQLRGMVRHRLLASVGTALDTLEALCKSAEDEEVRRKAAVDILDKAMPAAPAGQQNMTALVLQSRGDITVEDAKSFMRDARGKEVQSG